jgi:hypothetical protein
MTDKKVGIPKVSVGSNSGANLTLKVMDRFQVSALCPRKGTMEEQRHARSVATMVLLTQDESSDIALTTREGRLSWNHMRDFSREFHFTTAEINFLKDQVRRLDSEKGITSEMLDLCTKIKEVELKKSKVYSGKVEETG